MSICNVVLIEFFGVFVLRNWKQLFEDICFVLCVNIEFVVEFMRWYEDLFVYEVLIGGCVVYLWYKGEDGVEIFCCCVVEEYGVLLLFVLIYMLELFEGLGDCFCIGLGRWNVLECLEWLEEYLWEW